VPLREALVNDSAIGYRRIRRALGTDEALKEDKLCAELDPFGRWWSYGFALHRNRKFDEAIAEFKQRAEVIPSGGFGHQWMGLSYAFKGEQAKAVDQWKQQYIRDSKLL